MGELVIRRAGSFETLLPVAPEDTRCGQRQDRNIDTSRVHIFDALFVIEMRWFQDTEARTPVEDCLGTVEALPDFQVRPPMLTQKGQPLLREHVSVDIYNPMHSIPSES